jgi:hypothetical protein
MNPLTNIFLPTKYLLHYKIGIIKPNPVVTPNKIPKKRINNQKLVIYDDINVKAAWRTTDTPRTIKG